LSELEDRLLEEEIARKKADSLRGLYVAMTRAMDWLVVTGFGSVKESTDTWWTRVRDGFGENRVAGDDFEEIDQEGLPRFTVGGLPEGLPKWVEREVTVPLAGEVQSAAQVRGEAVHGLLQGLDVPADAEARAEAGRVREALPWLWAKGARSEMAVSLGGQVGRIDRLVERDGVWWVIDFKTGTVPELMPEVYASQVRGYVAALRATWPERHFKAGIVWTASARLDEVSI
jgi:ATP-dependent exoDNAse (exonuclease V) beta subunit